VVRALNEQLGAEVHFLTKEAFAPMLHCNPYVSRVIALTDDFNSLIQELKAADYDHIIDLHHNIRTKRIKMALGKPATSFHKLNFEKWLLVRFGINRMPDIHIVDRYIDTASDIGVSKDERGLDFFIPAEREVDIPALFGIQPGSFFAIVIGAAHQTKCLTDVQIAGLCDLLDKPVILLGGKNEREKADAIKAQTSAPFVKNACGQLDILQSASVIRQAGSVITHDTGLMHITAALKKPQVVIWGNTTPLFGMYPYYGKDRIKWISIEQSNLKCRPCSKLGFPQCPKGHFKCILDHRMQDIADAAQSIHQSSIEA
jgi:ADP-heptose:LPS heptosyltransferase